ncbi:hypothetical protein TNIN_212321 [Trichonephila inaurata madagascariensis]|uniref:Sema domain-containing protein n=1 Tax=Trichonephila inaurata madagascariensis TaxID=2747483 RepID=A0A8X7BV87_9ARAC|nr:hypothetical protein TNIN_212321 [Trichonephila inaurata madagascariensis]
MNFFHRRTWAAGRRKVPLLRRISNRWWWCVLWSVLCLSWSATQASGILVTSYTTPNETVVFHHVAVDSLSGRVYVGATNWLFQLNSGLELDRAVQTGPVEDNIQCFPGACSEQQLASLDNVNKILVVDEVSRRLLVCGSVYQGACQRRELEDIAVSEDLVLLPVAANDETSSTVAFVGPARYMGYPSRVLYVATTNSRLGPYRDMVPAICSRYLEDDRRLFGVIEKSFSEILRVDISSQVRDYYLVNYIYGFHSGDYVYFATLQRRSHLRSMEEGGYISRLARICVSDARYDSYVETTLQCLGPDGRDYNLLQDAHIVRAEPADLLVGVFAASRDHTVHSSDRSAVCVFSLADVEQRFTENIHLCYNGSVPSRDMDYIAGSIQDCPEPGGGNIFNFCGESLKLNGSLPLTSLPVITYENITLSSVVATTTSQHTVAFIGTRNGLLKKILIDDEAEEFEEVVVDEGNPILPDMHLDPTETHIYAASPYKISKVRIEECNRYEACDQCLRARNPYCGWCSLEKRCTVKAACQNATLTTDSSSPRWLSLNTQQCIDFQAIRPEHLPRNSLSIVELVINQLPQLPYGAHYMCVFGRSTPVRAQVTDQGLACLAPVLAERPPIPSGKDHVSVDLAVRSSETNKDFLNRLFAFYDCERLNVITMTTIIFSIAADIKVVELSRVHPNKGPQSGGTRLYLIGANLNVGSQLQVLLDDIPCEVDRTLASNSQISCRTTKSPIPSYNVSQLRLSVDNALLTLPNPFIYRDDPVVKKITPLKSFVSGGRAVTVSGVNFLPVQQPRMVVYYNDSLVNETICEVRSDHMMVCPSPSVSGSASKWQLAQADYMAEESSDHLLKLRIGFIMDGVESVRSLQDSFPSLHSDLTYVSDPKFFSFEEDAIKLYKGESLVIEGENLRLASTESEVNVTIGTQPCNLTSLASTQLVCFPPEVQPTGTDEIGRRTDTGLPMVVIRVGRNLRFEVGYLRYEVAKRYELPPEAVGGIAAGGAVLVLFSLIILAVLRHKNSQAEREYKRIQLQMDTLENSVRSECKQAFAELQTDMTDLTNDLETCGIPTLDHRTYVMKVFFPGVYDHPLLQETKLRQNGMYSTCEVAMAQFEQLVNNKCFLLTFIKTLEAQKSFSFRDRVNVASLLMVILLEKMEYATDVLRALLLQLIEKSVNTKHPQLMLRRTESVVEKMLTNWMALSMYDYLKNEAGSSLFLLFSAIKHQVEKGPVDAITHDARYSLSEERLLREQIEYSIVVVQVVHEDQDEKIVCRVNDCDATSQVKAKLLDAVYKNTPFSLRPSLHDVDLEWRHGRGGHLTLADEDLTTKTIHGWRRLNTLRHYGVKDSAVMSLVTKQNDSFSSNCTGNASLNSVSPIVGHYDVEQGLRYWHLVKYQDDQSNIKDYNHKSIPEIFLTRLLSTKGTVQKFVDDFLTTILTANERLPPAVKWLFDLLDEASAAHGILDPEVAHAWKSNSLPLRFWVNFIKNPDFVLDIQKTPVVDSCLSVIAQTLMDACSTSEHRLGKDSPSNKLLFAKDIPTYRKMVNRFYQDVASLPPVTDQEMCVAMQALSMSHNGEFDITSALRELYVYAAKYNDQVLEALDTDPYCQKMHLAEKLETVACTLEGEETSVC